MTISNSGYQEGTTAAPQVARRVLAELPPQVEELIGQPGQVVIGSANANSKVSYTAKTAATSNSAITVTYVVSGVNTALSVSVAGNAITVNVATDAGGNPTSTASQIVTAVNANGPASALVTASLTPDSTGAGVVAAQAASALVGGRDKGVGTQSNAPYPIIPPIHNVYNQR